MDVPALLLAPRIEARHSDISVGLRYCMAGQWQSLRAFGWNAGGFNFYSPHLTQDTTLALRRGLAQFEGSIVWRASGDDAQGQLVMLVNELLFQRARQVGTDKALHARLIRLIRAPMLVSEKRRVLASLGVALDDDTLSRMVARRTLEQPLYRYGVRVDSDVWRAVVAQAIEMAAAVASLENVATALTRF